jgi:signal transduction histidine kinase
MLAELAEWNETLEQQINERTGQVRALARALARAEQEERRRIAQVLHDDVQQMLTALHIQMSLLEPTAGPDVRAVLAELGDLTRQTIKATRSLSAELSAPALHGEDLGDMLAALAAVMAEHYRLQVQVEMKGRCTIADRSLREQIWMAARELLFNVVKHADVHEARVVAEPAGDSVTISIEDDGVGFDADAASRSAKIGKSMGLLTMAERIEVFGGRFEIESTPGVGTRATITMPVGKS